MTTPHIASRSGRTPGAGFSASASLRFAAHRLQLARIALLNLMPTKQVTERQFRRAFTAAARPVDWILTLPDGYRPTTTSADHIARFYTPWSQLDLSALDEAGREARAAKVIADAKRVGVERFEVSPSDIATPRPRMTLAFLAAIINAFPGLEPVAGLEGGVADEGDLALRGRHGYGRVVGWDCKRVRRARWRGRTLNALNESRGNERTSGYTTRLHSIEQPLRTSGPSPCSSATPSKRSPSPSSPT